MDIHGVYVPYYINDKGILQIVLTEEIKYQIWDISYDSKKAQNFIEIDLTGMDNLNGFRIAAALWPAMKVELFEDVRLFISPTTAGMIIEDNDSGGEVLLEAANQQYQFTHKLRIRLSN